MLLLQAFLELLIDLLRSVAALLYTDFPSETAAQEAMPSPQSSSPRQVQLLRLTDSGAPAVPNQYVYLPPPTLPPYTLRFEIEGTSSVCRNGTFWTNIPQKDQKFKSDAFQKHP